MSNLPISNSSAGSMGKEKEVLNDVFPVEESYPVVEMKEKEIDKEIEPYIQKIEKEIYLSKPITDDFGQTLVTASSAQPTQIILPITQKTLLVGLKQSVNESVRWLAEWCLRIFKIFGQRAIFRQEGENG
jgi:hypothetical protein